MMYPTFNSNPNYIGIGQGAAASRLRRRREEEGKGSPAVPLYEGMKGTSQGVAQFGIEPGPQMFLVIGAIVLAVGVLTGGRKKR